MRQIFLLFLFLFLWLLNTYSQASFSAPDTVCVNSPVTINNTSIAANSYYWNFCVSTLNTSVSTNNLGNPGGNLSWPVFMDYVFYNNNYYGFSINHYPGNLIRLDFGNSLLNTPTSVNLGNFGGIIPTGYGSEGIQIVQNEGKWYAIIVGGNPVAGSTPRILKVDFGANLANQSPIATDWGNIGNMLQPVDLHVFKEGNNWYGLTVSAENNTITRFNFTNSFNNIPTGTNLGNIGNLDFPTGIYAVNDNNSWSVFVVNGTRSRTNGTSNSSLTRLDFGSSLLNTPTGTNLGNPGNFLQHPRDITILKTCNQIIGFAVNGNPNYNDVVKFDFKNNLKVVPTLSSLGAIGGTSFPHSISKLFRVENDLYAFVSNVENNTITRLKFAGCNNSSTPSSSLQNPPDIVYNAPGTYNINLTVDDGLSTQSAFCKQVVVLPKQEHSPIRNISLCPGDNIKLGSSSSIGVHLWNTGATTDSILINSEGSYWVETNQFGCINRDSFFVSIANCGKTIPSFLSPDTVCVNDPVNITNTSVGSSSYYWNFCVADIGNTLPEGVNLGNPNGALNIPVFMDYVQVNADYYAFIINLNTNRLVRLDFGNSLLNSPSTNILGDFGGIIPLNAEGIQVMFNEGRWYAIIVGGAQSISTGPRIVKIDFGPDITNLNPTATNWGNIGGLTYPVDLHVFKENNNWYGFTVNAESNTVTRFNFGSSFSLPPTGVNLGNIGNLNYPTGIFAVSNNGEWHVFITNAGGGGSNSPNSSLSRLDFGNSLLNNPTGINLGNLNTRLRSPRDLYILNFCNQLIGFLTNYSSEHDIVRLNFNNNIMNIPEAFSLGNIGNLNFPHSISKLFRQGPDLYGFITNAANNTLTRLKFTGCTSSSIANSSAQNPTPIIYNVPGNYNINLSIDDGLPTQSAFCRNVVVMPALTHTPTQKLSFCEGDSILLSSNFSLRNKWSTGSNNNSVYVRSQGLYWIETTNGACTNRDTFLVTVKPAPFQVNLGKDTLICSSNVLVLDAGNPGASYLWNNGATTQSVSISTEGNYYVTVTKNSCSSTDTIQVTANKTGLDFEYKIDICNPLTVQFIALGNTSNSSWDFGDGTPTSGASDPSHTFRVPGNFNIKYSASDNQCNNSVTKTVTLGIIADDIITTKDTIVCSGLSSQLQTIPSLNFCWSPTTFLDNPNSPNPITSTPYNITYYFTAEVTGNNLITNGDFSVGNTGFTSQYNYTNPNFAEAQYYVGTNATAWNNGLNSCPDHTGGSGNMMIVNGSSSPDVEVWRLTVPVTPNTNYAFSTWIQALFAINPAQLQFSINENEMGQTITASSQTCKWTQFYATWNSGNNSSATISIVNKNTQVQGSYFALDDISFAPVFIKRDSVVIMVEDPTVKANKDTTFCEGNQIQLTATGAFKYSWLPSIALNNSKIGNPIATPVISTRYIVTGTTLNGCNAKDTVDITILPKPAITIINDTTICKNSSLQLSGSGGTSYKWSPTSTLTSPFVQNPIATPITNTAYYLTITDDKSCTNTDSVNIEIWADPIFSINMPVIICLNESIQLNASGGKSYLWQPNESLNSINIPNPNASPKNTTTYSVLISDNCDNTATLSTTIKVLSVPNIQITKSNDIDCSNDESQLNAIGAQRFLWNNDITSLSNRAIANPIAFPQKTTVYYVTGYTAEGCSSQDSITVKVSATGLQSIYIPSAFTPNNDGKNDCFRIKNWVGTREFKLEIFNRWGEKVYSSADITSCWDGTFKGIMQPTGVYVYIVKAKALCGDVNKKGLITLIH
jgi:gliding motility-associated-like protein